MSPNLHHWIPGFTLWILDSRYWIPVFVSGPWNSGFQSLVGFRIPDSKLQDFVLHKANFLGFRISQEKNSWRCSCVAKQSRTCSWPPDRAEWNNKTTGLNCKGRFRPRLRGPDKFLKGQNLAWIWPYQKYKCRSKFLTGTVRFLRRLV